jgi:hypothetical protein
MFVNFINFSCSGVCRHEDGQRLISHDLRYKKMSHPWTFKGRLSPVKMNKIKLIMPD